MKTRILCVKYEVRNQQCLSNKHANVALSPGMDGSRTSEGSSADSSSRRRRSIITMAAQNITAAFTEVDSVAKTLEHGY